MAKVEWRRSNGEAVSFAGGFLASSQCAIMNPEKDDKFLPMNDAFAAQVAGYQAELERWRIENGF